MREEFFLESIIGNSHNMKEIYGVIKKAAPSRSTILIYGESGTGKELIARVIHSISLRRNKPFIPVCCGSLSETLLESELFGHIKGSFTGAYINKPGLFEVANGGTFFLDEIGDIGLSTQGKLLRVLQEREFTPVGGTKSIKVDVRLVAATNKDLRKAIESGNFREDLYYRLNVIPINLPPLRERKEDIPALSYYFLSKYNLESDKSVEKISNEAMTFLLEYDWPGNVRELENVVERAVILATGDIINIEDLPLFIDNGSGRSESLHGYREAKKLAVEEFDKRFIMNMLIKCSGNITKAASLAKMDRRNFQKLLRKYKIKITRGLDISGNA